MDGVKYMIDGRNIMKKKKDGKEERDVMNGSGQNHSVAKYILLLPWVSLYRS